MHKIYYSDGTVSESDTPPPRDVQVIVQEHPDVGVELVTGADYYIKINNVWVGVDIFGLFDFLLDSNLVLFGRMMSTKEYQTLLIKAANDKQLWLQSERRS